MSRPPAASRRGRASCHALLKEDIAKRGIISPIIKDAAGNIIDGFHRNKIAEELGLTDIPIKQVAGTEAELQAMAIALNVARRQLDAEDRQKLVTQLRAEGKSTRQIAEQIGVDQSTVVRDLAKASDATASVDRVTGKDGKSRPARMTRKPKAKPAADLKPDNIEPAAEEQPATATEPTEPPTAATVELKPAPAAEEPTMEQFAALWARASRALRNEISKFVEKKTDEARKLRAEMVKAMQTGPQTSASALQTGL